MSEEEEYELQKKTLAIRLERCCFTMLRPSGIVHGGVGVFACTRIPKGTEVFRDSVTSDWYGFSKAELRKLPAHLQKLAAMFCTVEDGERFLPSLGFNNLTVDFYINHSTKPNLILDDSDAEYKFTAARDIADGEELTYDYRTVEGIYDPAWDK